MPDNTKDLVDLTKYLENASSVMVMGLQTQVDEAAERLLFLLDYATLPCKFKLWWSPPPLKMQIEFPVTCRHFLPSITNPIL